MNGSISPRTFWQKQYHPATVCKEKARDMPGLQIMNSKNKTNQKKTGELLSGYEA